MIRFIPRRYWAVIAVALALTMSVLDGTIVNVALPTLSREFGTSPSSTIWIVNAYQLTITMSLLSFSALGDIYGYKRIFLIGTTIFCSTSLFCALSSSFAMLTVARILQGGAAGKKQNRINLSNTWYCLYFVQLRIAKVKERLPYSCDST